MPRRFKRPRQPLVGQIGTARVAASPALALSPQVPTNPGTGHGPANPGSGNPNSSTHPQQPAGSHKCRPHKVAYVASGALVSQSLTKSSDGTYSVDQTDMRPGDRTTVIGKVTTLAKKCDHSGFTAQTTIRKVLFNQPRQS